MPFITTILFLLFSLTLSASGIQINNLHWDGAQQVRMEVSWQHSWKLVTEPGNYDAAWIFGKIKAEGSLDWKALEFTSANTQPGFQTELPTDGIGSFLFRDQEDVGETGNVTLILELSEPVSGVVDIRFFGVEMVFIPEGSFWLGDGASTNSFKQASGIPIEITSEFAIPAGEIDTTIAYVSNATIPAAYPKGHAGFYSMKYELSQSGYTAFLNTLSIDAQIAHTELVGNWAFDFDNLYRNGIAIQQEGISPNSHIFGMDANRNGIFNEAADGGDRAVNGIHWLDLTAWLDWAGLRPMTEFEFEKMARGPELPVAGEFAWGTDLIVDANALMDDGHSTEYVTDLIDAGAGIASHGYAGPKGGLRNGFAGRDNSDRMKAGAGYYGVLELSGNLWELTINMLPEGLTFTGNHGDGNLIDGQSDAGWPGVDGGGFRGGAWNSGIGPIGFFRDLAISDRWYAGLGPTDRRFTNGIRGVRTAE